MAIEEISEEEARTLGLIPAEVSQSEATALGVPAPIGQATTAVLHGAQGATAGLSDEATGVAAGLLATGPGRWLREKTGVFPLNPDGSDPFAPEGGGYNEAKQGATASARELNKQAAKENPKTAFVADAAASVASPLGKLGAGAKGGAAAKALKAGATQGAIGGFGYSESSDLVGLSLDTALGAGVGSTFSGVATGLQGGVRAGRDALKARALRKGEAALTDSLPPVPAGKATQLTQAGVEPATAPGTMRDTGPATQLDVTQTPDILPDAATQNIKPPAKTEVGALSSPDQWTDYLKGRIGPAMSRNGNNAAKAMAELAKEFRALSKKKATAKTIVEGDTILDGPPAAVAERENAKTLGGALARTVPDLGSQTIPDGQFAKTDMALPPPRVPIAADAPKPAPKPDGKSDYKLLEEDFRKGAEGKREELAQMIQSEITEGPSGLKTTPTKQKQLDQASEAIVAEVVDGPDAKTVRKAYLGRAKQGQQAIQKVVETVKAKNDAAYALFEKAGKATIGHDVYLQGLARAAAAANKAGKTTDAKLLDFLAVEFETMRKRSGGTVDLKQLRGWTTDVQDQAASAIGGLNEHRQAAIKARAARLITEQMYETMAKAAKGNPALQAAAERIGKNNKRLQGLLTIEEALSMRRWKEQNEMPFAQKAAQSLTGAAIGAGAGMLLGQENALEGAGAGALIGLGADRGKLGAAIGRRVQRNLTGDAIKATQALKVGRDATLNATEAAQGTLVGRAMGALDRATYGLDSGAPADVTVLDDKELQQELVNASIPARGLKGAVKGRDEARFNRAIREIQRRKTTQAVSQR